MRRLSRPVPWALALVLFVAPPPVEAQVRVAIDWLYPAESIYFSDFDPFSPGLQPDLFAMTFQNLTGDPQSVVLEVSVAMERPRNLLILRSATNPFTLAAGVRRISSRDVATTGRDVSAAYLEFGATSDELTDQLRQTGRFPAGTYRFTVEVRTAQGVVLDQASVVRDVVNPTRIELLSPGRPFDEPAQVIRSTTPPFLWSGDAPVTTDGGDFLIRVVRVDDAVSPEEAMSGFATWEARVRTTATTYPASVEAIPLEQGRTYAWQVHREVRTSGGTETIDSPVYRFRLAPRSGTTADSGASPEFIELLEALLRASGLGGDLGGFLPSGTPLIGGQPISWEALEEILRRMTTGEVPVGSVTVR